MTKQAASPQISVVMPTYNRADTVSRAIDSILNQTCKDFELIVVNDGSTDGTQTILESYAQKDPRIKIVVQKNGGSARARNHGVQHAKGEYIAFMDDDDISTPERLEKQLACLMQAPCYKACVCVTTKRGVVAQREKNRVQGPWPVQKDKLNFPLFILDATMLIEKKAFETCGGYNPHFVVKEDTEFTLQFLKKYSAIALKDSFYIVTDRGDGKDSRYSFLSCVYRVSAYIHIDSTYKSSYAKEDVFSWGTILTELPNMSCQKRKQLFKKCVSGRKIRNKIYEVSPEILPASYIFFLFFLRQFRIYKAFWMFNKLKFLCLLYFWRQKDFRTLSLIWSLHYFSDFRWSPPNFINGPFNEPIFDKKNKR